MQGGQSTLRPNTKHGASGRLRARTKSAPDIVELAEPAHKAALLWARRPVGVSTVPLHSYFAMISASQPVRLIAKAQAAHVRRIWRHGPFGDLPMLSAAAPFHAGGRGGPERYTHIAADRLTQSNVFDIYPHPNTLAALLVTRATLHEWLERSFSQLHLITLGAQGQTLWTLTSPASTST